MPKLAPRQAAPTPRALRTPAHAQKRVGPPAAKPIFQPHHAASKQPDPQDVELSHGPNGTLFAEVPSAVFRPDAAEGSLANYVPALEPRRLTAGPLHAEAERIRQIVGVPLTEEGLADLMAGCLPGSKVLCHITVTPENKVHCAFTLRDGTGEEIGHFGHEFERKGDAVELTSKKVWVDPEYRNQAITARLCLTDIALLRSVSTHRDSCIRLLAGGGSGEKLGTYWWARCGLFEFAHPDDLERTKDEFYHWTQRLPLDAATRAQLQERSEQWTHPHEVATMQSDGLIVPAQVGDSAPRPCDVGKAFLLDPNDLTWWGNCYVNRKANQHALAGLNELRQKIARADVARDAREAEWKKTLDGGTPAEKLAVLSTLGRFAGDAWLAVLEPLQRDVLLTSAAVAAAERISGKSLLPEMRRIFEDPARPYAARSSAFLAWTYGGGRLTREIAQPLMTVPELRFDVLDKAARDPHLTATLHKALDDSFRERAQRQPARAEAFEAWHGGDAQGGQLTRDFAEPLWDEWTYLDRRSSSDAPKDGSPLDPTFNRGQRVRTEWENRWFNATIEDTQLGLYRVHFDYDDAREWDMWVGSRRLRHPEPPS